jgi:PKD repeat protein
MKSKLVFAVIPMVVLCISGCSKKANLPSAIASFGFSAVGGNMHAPATIDFTDNGDYAWHFNWQFGDGDSSADESPGHRYVKAGTYNVKLSAQGFNDDSAAQTVTILPAYVSVQIDTIQLQVVVGQSGTVTGYFKITDGNSNTYWQSPNVSINTNYLPVSFAFASTPVLTYLNSNYSIELWIYLESYEPPIKLETAVLSPYLLNQGTSDLDSYPATEDMGGLHITWTWK